MRAMPVLTRRLYRQRSDCWHVYYGDVHVGTIALRTGCPHDEDPWEWSCGFYPGSRPGEYHTGTAVSFEQARADFLPAWAIFLAGRSEADFQAWRDQRDFTARKYAMWDAGEKMPTQKYTTMMRCVCGEMFDSHRVEHTRIHVRHMTAAHQAEGIRR